MKHVFSNSECIHVFAQQNKGQEWGKGSSVSFDGAILKSYSAPIANIVSTKKKIVLITNRQYSVTTSTHTSMARCAMMHYTRISVYDVDIRPCYKLRSKTQHQSNIHLMTKELTSLWEKQKRAITSDYTRCFNSATENFQRYINLFHLKGLLTKQQREFYDGKTLVIPERIAKNIAIRSERVEKRCIEWDKRWKDEQRIFALTLPEKIAAFHNHEIQTLPYQAELAYLRLNIDRSRIETSKGSRVLVEHARILWNTIVRAMAKGEDFVPVTPIVIDYYTLTKVTKDGTIIVGCHNIPFEESRSIALQLGWVTE